MTTTRRLPSQPDRSGETTGLAVLGSPAARLLAGPDGPETLAAHLLRLGPLPDWTSDPDGLVRLVTAAGLTGRGGGHFPLGEKLRVAVRSPGRAVAVVNATESEPASAKDRLLLTARPHLVLDGALALAAAIGAEQVLVAGHAGSPGLTALAAALGDRDGAGVDIRLVDVPERYIAGESSALTRFLGGGPALPVARSRPTAVAGIDGRPTVVTNAETVSHLALVARRGADWFRQVGTDAVPGSVLLTIAGDVDRPGQVVEVVGPATIGSAIRLAGSPDVPPQAVLIGGYAGTWLPGAAAWRTPVDPGRLARAGSPIGCGLVGVLGTDRCGPEEVAGLLGWLSGQRAGQCGACTAGLPALAAGFAEIAAGTRRARSGADRLVTLGESIAGQGLCRLPDGAVAMLGSACVVFDEEIQLHRRGRCAATRTGPPAFALPSTPVRR